MIQAVIDKTLLAYARGFPLRKGKLRLINMAWPLTGGGPFRSARLKHGGFTIQCDLREALQRQFYFFGTYFIEETILAQWANFAAAAHVTFDIGANAGIYSLAAVAANRDLQVHAFEPTPEIAERLRATVRENGLNAQIHVHEQAVSERSGRASLMRWRGGDDANGGMNFIVERPDAGPESVETVSIDDFCAANAIASIDLLKMDIQGHEASALRGAQEMLFEGRIRTIFLELNWAGPDEPSSAQECVDLLSAAGYMFSAPRAELAWAPAGTWLRSFADVIATRPDAERNKKAE